MTTLAAVDIGYGNTKFTYQVDGAPAQEVLFRSIAAPASARLAGTESLGKRDTRLVHVEDTAFEIGPDAHLALGPWGVPILHDDYIDSPEYYALFLGALSYIGQSKIDVMVTGLPVQHMQTHRDRLAQRLSGDHQVEGLGTVQIGRVVVTAQPVGGLLHAMATDGTLATAQTTLLVDPGYLTLDWCGAEGHQLMTGVEGSIDTGVSVGLQAAAKYITEQLGAPFRDLVLLDRKLRSRVIRVAGKVLDYVKINHLITEALRPGVAAMRNQLRNAQSFDRIVVCGGGADYYRDLVRETWPNHSVQVVRDPVMANVRGYLHMASHLAGAMKGVAA